MSDEADSSEKTEDPTQKRLDEALERGDVVKSQEVNTWFMIGGAALVFSTWSGSIGSGLQATLKNLIANSWQIHTDGDGLILLTASLVRMLIAVLGVPFLFLMIAALKRSSRNSPSCRRWKVRNVFSASRRWPISPRASSNSCCWVR